MPYKGQLKVEDGLTYEWQEPPGEWVVRMPHEPLQRPNHDIVHGEVARDDD